MFEPKAIFFDLDGTIIDSIGDLTVAITKMLIDLEHPEPELETVKSWVGNGVPRLVKRALTLTMEGEPEPALFNRARPLFDKHYQANLAGYSELYDSVEITLQQLTKANIPLVCITNKDTRFTEPLLKNLGVDHYFKAIIGGDALPQKKPEPEPLFFAAKQCNVAINECLMVGDSRSDIQAARAAGCPVVAVTYGYNHGEDIRLSNPDITIDTMDQLLPLLKI